MYDSKINENEQAYILYICDLPNDISVLENILQQVNPVSIHIIYHVEESAFFNRLPTSDEFKWLYGYALQYGPVQLKVDLPNIIQTNKWTKEKVIIMLKVFLDLEFITISNDILYVNREAEKQSLDQSKVYQKRIKQSKMEQTLYYATYDEIKQWIQPFVQQASVNKDEVVYEL